jgi:hypothetical protein
MLGSALGGAARYWFSGVVSNSIGEMFPWGTMLVNISGSFVIGFFSTLTGPGGRLLVSTTARQFVMIGLCGGPFPPSACKRSISREMANGCGPVPMPAYRSSSVSLRCGLATSSPRF